MFVSLLNDYGEIWLNPAHVVAIRPIGREDAMILTSTGVEYKVIMGADEVVQKLQGLVRVS